LDIAAVAKGWVTLLESYRYGLHPFGMIPGCYD